MTFHNFWHKQQHKWLICEGESKVNEGWSYLINSFQISAEPNKWQFQIRKQRFDTLLFIKGVCCPSLVFFFFFLLQWAILISPSPWKKSETCELPKIELLCASPWAHLYRWQGENFGQSIWDKSEVLLGTPLGNIIDTHWELGNIMGNMMGTR
jgi:hypothetical protein